MQNENHAADQEMEARLWAYIDGLSDEAPLIETLVAEQKAWQEKYAELLAVHQLVEESTELDQPSLRFTRNVMEEIARLQIAPAAKEYINKKIVWGLALFFVFLIAGFVVYGFAQVDWSAGAGSPTFLGINTGAIDLSKLFGNSLMNLFMLLNVVAGLFLLDRILAAKRKKLLDAA